MTGCAGKSVDPTWLDCATRGDDQEAENKKAVASGMQRLLQRGGSGTGLEPATPGVTGRYSNQLNYHSW